MIGIKEIGIYIPEGKESNYEKKERFDLDNAFIMNTLGVESVSLKAASQETSDMCVEAYNNLSLRCGINRELIDCIVVVTQNPDGNGLPHTSAVVHEKLDLVPNCAAFDISLGCSGYVYGLSVISAFMQANNLKNGLLFTADPYSKIIDREDRTTVLLFGDAATCTYLTEKPTLSPSGYAFGTMGKEMESLICKKGTLKMNGRAVFNFSATEVPSQITKLLSKYNRSIDEIDLFILHQASKFILNTIRTKLQLPENKVPIEFSSYGNTVSSSIPIVLQKYLHDVKIQHFLLSGFGVGLSLASALVERSGLVE
jgi:3-oxoacyl-[acyl-carrier-protein] synthase-3